MIHVIHGLFGSPKDFSFMASDQVIFHDLYAPLADLRLSDQDTLVGYSMGGRKAMELAHQHRYRLKKLVLLSAHPGLDSLIERNERKTWEDQLLRKMEKTPADEFLDYWNSLPLFQHDCPLTSLGDYGLESSSVLFEQNRLSRQRNYLPDLALIPDKVIWIVGEDDEKYRHLTQSKVLPLGLGGEFIKAGHRLFQHPSSLMRVLHSKGIL